MRIVARAEKAEGAEGAEKVEGAEKAEEAEKVEEAEEAEEVEEAEDVEEEVFYTSRATIGLSKRKLNAIFLCVFARD